MTRLYELVKTALQVNPAIAVPVNEIHTSVGYDENYLRNLGLRRTDLKRLERAGLAVRGYLPRNPVYYYTKEKVKALKKHEGYQVRWMLVKHE